MGKWSKKAREKQSVRLKAYWKARKENGKPSKPFVVKQEFSISERLGSIIYNANEIRKQLGMEVL